MKKPARAEVEDVKRRGKPVEVEKIARQVIEVNEYSNKAAAKETEAPKRKCPSSQPIAYSTNCGVMCIFTRLPGGRMTDGSFWHGAHDTPRQNGAAEESRAAPM